LRTEEEVVVDTYPSIRRMEKMEAGTVVSQWVEQEILG